MTNIKRYIFLIITVAIMLFIFIMSSQNATKSNGSSQGVIEVIARIIIRNYDNKPVQFKAEVINNYQHFIRKAAHFTIYCLLGISTSGFYSTFKFKKSFSSKIVAAITCVVYSVSDEIHQIFVPGRAGMVTDVLLDSTGAFFGIVVFTVVSLQIAYSRGKKYGKL